MKSIQDYDFWYTFLRPYVDWYFRHSYRHCRYEGLENIPTDGSIIYAPNHQNGLMDALAVLSLDSAPKVFVARADIFRNPKIARILHWLKIMPISRVRDGLDQVRHNDETMDRAVEVLSDGVPFCILPEGTHRRKHALLPLQKGIFHIALQAAQKSTKPLYIVPVGLDYADWYHQWDDLTISVGKPMDVRAFIAGHLDMTEPQLINAMREELTSRMSSLFPCVADDDHYEENWAAYQAAHPSSIHPFIPSSIHPFIPSFLHSLILFLLAPLAILSAIVTLPLWILPLALRRKIKDPAFRNSILYVWTWVLLPWLLFIPLLFWWFIQEYLYQIRKIINHKS
ncbi:MAG: 1-acyl-sn-glycerol-3-phosphate acyltransferase [Elusimicrobiaceae bacterium]|nr:1-acyl-sn-glycerol-3-phosphate acyltransferase [Elusimicrobiaceae bacterium]